MFGVSYFSCMFWAFKKSKGYVFKYADENVLNLPPRNCPNKVDYIDKKGNVIETYDSVKSAAFDLGAPYYSIYKVLRGELKETKDGYRFKINS